MVRNIWLAWVLAASGCVVNVNADKADSGDTGFPGDGSPPSCEITRPTEGEILGSGLPISLEATAEDKETNAPRLDASWSSSLAGDLGTATPDENGVIVLETTALSPGSHILTLTVTDPSGNDCVDEVVVEVEGAPGVMINAPIDGSVVAEGDITFSALVGDLEDAAETLILSWEDDQLGVLDTTAAGADGIAAFTTSSLGFGVHTVTLSATDSTGITGQASVTFTVNSVPTQPEISLAPVNPTTVDDLVVSITTPSTDAEGSAVTYNYEWSVDGVVSGASTSDTLPADATTRGEVWTVTVTPTDGISNGPSATATVAILNSAPEITLTVDPDGVVFLLFTDSVITATATVVDPDGDPVTFEYQWMVNGLLTSETSNVLDGALWFDKDDVVDLTVTATDGLDTATATWNGAILNSPPVAGTIQLTPALPTDDDDLLCEIVKAATDPDGDLITYVFVWDHDGIIFPSATMTVLPEDTAGALFTKIGEIWTCAVTPFDGKDTGATRTKDVEIL